MTYYETKPLSDQEVSIRAGEKCVGLGTGSSHEDLIYGAGGATGYGEFKNPIPGDNRSVKAERIYTDSKNNNVYGVDLHTSDGKYCCSYTGTSYEDIKDSNQKDYDKKLEQSNTQGVSRNNNGIER